MAYTPFSRQKLLECLNDKEGFNVKFKEYRQRFLEVDMSYIRGTIDTVKDILSGKTAPPLQRMLSLRALKEGFESYQYAFLMLLEVELLPILKSIARYRKGDRDDSRGSTYFTQLYQLPATKEVESLGASFLRFVLESLAAWAIIKRYYCIQDEQIDDIDSEFYEAFKELQNEGVTFPRTYVYYKEAEFDSMKEQYYERLDRITENRQRYLDCYEKILKNAISNSQNYAGQDAQQLLKLCRNSDTYLIAASLKVIEEILIKRDNPLPKILALKFLNELFKLGELEVIDFCTKLTQVLMMEIEGIPGGDLSLKRGAKMFPGEDGAKYGRLYYGEVLKSIFLWAKSIPTVLFAVTQSKQDTEFKKGYHRLKDVKKYEFPTISEDEIATYRNEVVANLELKEEKNEALHVILYEESGLRDSQASLPVNVSGSIRKPTLRQAVPSIIKQTIEERFETMRILFTRFRSLNGESDENRKWVASAMNYFRDFSESLENILANDERFDDLYGEGVQLMERSDEIIQIHTNWKKIGQPFQKMLESVQQYLSSFTIIRKDSGGSRIRPSGMRSSIKKSVPSILGPLGQQPVIESEFKQAKSMVHESPQLSAITEKEQHLIQRKQANNEYFAVQPSPTVNLPTVTELPRPKSIVVQNHGNNIQVQSSFQPVRSKLSSESSSIHHQLKIEDAQKSSSSGGKNPQASKSSSQHSSRVNPNSIVQAPIQSTQSQNEELEELRRIKSQLRKQQISRLKEINEQSMRQSSLHSFQSFQSNQSNREEQELKAECEAVMLIADAMTSKKSKPSPEQPNQLMVRVESKQSQSSKPASRFGLQPSVMRDYGISQDVPAGQSIAERANTFAKDNGKAVDLQTRVRHKKLELVSCNRARSNLNQKLVPHNDNVLDSRVSLMKTSKHRGVSSETSLKGLVKTSVTKAVQQPYYNVRNKPFTESIQQYRCIHRESRVVMESEYPLPQPKMNLQQALPQSIFQQQPQSNSIIQQPLLQPMQNSYHELMEPSKLLLQANPTFKAALQIDPLIPTNNRSDKYWMEQNLKTLTKVASNDTLKKTPRTDFTDFSTLPEVLAERSSEHNKQIEMLNSLYNRRVIELQQCMKKLQKDVELRDRLVSEKQEQINSLRANTSQQNLTAMSFVNNEVDENRFYKATFPKMYNSQPPLSLNVDWVEPLGSLFSYAAYLHFLRNLQDYRSKRSMLKNKDILFKDKHLEVGVIVSRDTEVKVALYIQSESEVNELSLRLENLSPWMKLRVEPQFPTHLLPKKQEKCTVCFRYPDVKDLLYDVPTLRIRFRPSYSSAQVVVSLLLPVTFNRCVEFREPASTEELQLYFKDLVQSTPDFEYSTKILKDPLDIQTYFPKALSLPCQSGYSYGIIVNYKHITGAIVFWIGSNGRMHIKGCGRGTIEGEASRVIQSLLSTLMWLLCKEHLVSNL